MNVIFRLIFVAFSSMVMSSVPSFSQTIEIELPNEVNKLEGIFEFKHSIPNSYLIQLESVGGSAEGIVRGYKVRVLYEENGEVYFKYLKWNASAPDKATYENKVFKMKRGDFEKLTRKLYSRGKGFSTGAYTVPFRLRWAQGNQKFDFESSLSLQGNIVYGIGTRYKEDSYLNLSLGFGLTGVQLNPENTTLRSTGDPLSEVRTATAFTTSFGIVLTPSPVANIGVFIGWDNLGRADNDLNWIYEGNTWVGIGVNIRFNATKNSNEPTSGNLENGS
ncbi:MAG: hypothetical protein AAFQ94_10300 [Bacteroidota bacterium]